MSVQVAKDRREITCPKCENTWNGCGFDIKPEDILWVPNGHKCKMGYSVVEAHDPYPKKVTCKRCGKEFKIDYKLKEKVEFT